MRISETYLRQQLPGQIHTPPHSTISSPQKTFAIQSIGELDLRGAPQEMFGNKQIQLCRIPNGIVGIFNRMWDGFTAFLTNDIDPTTPQAIDFKDLSPSLHAMAKDFHFLIPESVKQLRDRTYFINYYGITHETGLLPIHITIALGNIPKLTLSINENAYFHLSGPERVSRGVLMRENELWLMSQLYSEMQIDVFHKWVPIAHHAKELDAKKIAPLFFTHNGKVFTFFQDSSGSWTPTELSIEDQTIKSKLLEDKKIPFDIKRFLSLTPLGNTNQALITFESKDNNSFFTPICPVTGSNKPIPDKAMILDLSSMEVTGKTLDLKKSRVGLPVIGIMSQYACGIQDLAALACEKGVILINNQPDVVGEHLYPENDESSLPHMSMNIAGTLTKTGGYLFTSEALAGVLESQRLAFPIRTLKVQP